MKPIPPSQPTITHSSPIISEPTITATTTHFYCKPTTTITHQYQINPNCSPKKKKKNPTTRERQSERQTERRGTRVRSTTASRWDWSWLEKMRPWVRLVRSSVVKWDGWRLTILTVTGRGGLWERLAIAAASEGERDWKESVGGTKVREREPVREKRKE